MYPEPPQYQAFFLPGPEEGLTRDEALALGIQWLLRQPGTPLIVLHAKKMATHAQLLVAVARRVQVVSPNDASIWQWPGGAVLAPWASPRVLRCIDDELAGRVAAVCVIGWVKGEHETWRRGHRAVDLRGGDAPAEPHELLRDPVARVALGHASNFVNHRNGLAQAEDRAYVVRTLLELLRGGHRFDVDDLAAYATATGWSALEVGAMRDIAAKALAGRSFRLRSSAGPRAGACARWEKEAANAANGGSAD